MKGASRCARWKKAAKALQHDADAGLPGGGRVGRAPSPGAFSGYRLLDPRGEKIGRVEQAFLDAHGGPEYPGIALGSLGLRRVLVPVLDVVVDGADRTLTPL